MEKSTDIILSHETLSLDKCRSFVSAGNCGGIAIFDGVVRNATSGKHVMRLEFEAYDAMAVSEMRKIADQALEKFEINKVVIHHRTGILGIGESAVIIAVSAAHRKAAFEACMYCIDTLKETVPIWKKEVFSDGEVWVAAHP